MTRAQRKALQHEVNSLLSMYDFDILMDGMLLHSDVLCLISWEPQELHHVNPRSGHGRGEKNDEATAEGEELPASVSQRKKTSGLKPPAQPPATGKIALASITEWCNSLKPTRTSGPVCAQNDWATSHVPPWYLKKKIRNRKFVSILTSQDSGLQLPT